MNRRRTANPFASPFLIWSDVAWKTGDMMLASAQVIGHRVARMAAAGSKPNARDRREFTLMGQEKIEAAAKSAQAMAAQTMRMNTQLGMRAVNRMLTPISMLSFSANRSVAQSMAQQAKLFRALAQSAVTASQLSTSAALLTRAGLKPIHSRATRNAKRLGKH